MPCIISTPEEWFRTLKRDLYIIQYRIPVKDSQDRPDENDEDESTFKQAQKKLNTWFEERLPHTPLRVIGDSEYSGWITGGPCYFTADFDPYGLDLFNSAWDENSAWHVEIWPVSDWQKRIDETQLLPSPVGELQKLRWWDTPQGILLLSAYTSDFGYCEDGFPSLEDGWWQLQQLFPELSEYQAKTFPCGQFWPFRMDQLHVDISVEYVWGQSWNSKDYANNAQNLQRIAEAIGIPEDIAVNMEVFEY